MHRLQCDAAYFVSVGCHPKQPFPELKSKCDFEKAVFNFTKH